MVIIRDGKEIPLTDAEIEEAYREKQIQYRMEDAKNQIELLGYPEVDAETLRRLANRYLDKEDCNVSENDAWEWLIKEHFNAYNTKIDYMYRDGANYKIWLHAILPGSLTPSEMDTVFELCRDGFYPGRYGLPADTFVSQGYKEYADDPDYHELIDIQWSIKEPTVQITAQEFYKKLAEE